MAWEVKGEARVLRSGVVDVGAVYPPAYAGGPWRWRIWVNGRQAADEGMRASKDTAMAEVERRYQAFLDNAWLTRKHGECSPGARGSRV